MLNTNVRSGFLSGAGVCAQSMRTDAGTAGRILFVTSLHNYTPRNLPHYSASKAGMTMIMKETGAPTRAFHGIRVNAIAPGAIPGGGFATSDDAFKPKRKISPWPVRDAGRYQRPGHGAAFQPILSVRDRRHFAS